MFAARSRCVSGKAWELAFFLHPVPLLADDVASRATLRHEAEAKRRRLRLGEDRLLQQLVFAESERVEREREKRGDATDSDLLVWYVKHLVHVSSRRNFFHLALGVTRILYGLDAGTAADIHCALIADADAIKDESYCRARKRLLTDELYARFETRLELVRRDRGEIRIATTIATESARRLVHHSLESFAPWEVSCDGSGELHAIHTLLHAECFRRRFGFDPLATLQVPRFRRGDR